MAKKGRHGGNRKQQKHRKPDAEGLVNQNSVAKQLSEVDGHAERETQAGAEGRPACGDLGHVLGLTNLGHTCFFNAAVQAWSSGPHSLVVTHLKLS